MASTIVKTKHPFDNLLYWNEYINYINQEFPEPEENNKWTPQVDIKEKDGNYLLQMDIPGFSLRDIDIKYKNGFLTIKGEKKALINNGQIRNHKPDSFSDNFKSVVRFPQGIEKKKIIKVLKNGILQIRIPVPSDLEEQSKHLKDNAKTNERRDPLRSFVFIKMREPIHNQALVRPLQPAVNKGF